MNYRYNAATQAAYCLLDMNQSLEANVSSLHDLQAHALTAAQQRIQQDLLTALEAFALPEPLKSAVHHAVMLGGKRVRPA